MQGNDKNNQHALSPERLVQDYGDLVQRMVNHLWPRLPKIALREDLVQAGMVGLLEAGQRYRDDRGAKFTTYASIRIRGAILDEVRRHSWVSRSVYGRASQMKRAAKKVQLTADKPLNESDMAHELGISPTKYRQWQQEVANQQPCHCEEISEAIQLTAPAELEPETVVLNNDVSELFMRALQALTDQQQLVFHFYYEDDLKLKEIGQRIGVTESRACQIYQTTIKAIQTRITL